MGEMLLGLAIGVWVLIMLGMLGQILDACAACGNPVENDEEEGAE